ncbi:MAG: MarR family transcriptional regulator [Methanomassiliicoccales archaeon]
MRSKKLAIIVAVAGAAIMLFGLLTPSTSSDASGGMMGSGGGSDATVYSLSNAVIIMIGAFLTAIGGSYWAFKEDYVPVAEVFSHPRPSPNVTDAVDGSIEQTNIEEGAPSIPNEYALTLRLLSGDERQMFRTIVDLGGEALQKDLIVRTKMSDAKVSRVIDRLVEKELVTKERHGVTNKVRITVDN